MNSDDFIKEYYRDIAQTFGDSPKSTMEDSFIRSKEVAFFVKEVKRFIDTFEFYPSILDVGCGNGHLLRILSEQFPQCSLYGLEFSPDLYQLALKRNIANCHIQNGDMRNKKDMNYQVDIVISERSLINVKSFDQQSKALENISHCLSIPGRYLMSESFKTPLENLNSARKEFTLEPLKESIQNLYLSQSLNSKFKSCGFKEIAGLTNKNELSTHFYLSRVFHYASRPEGGRKKETQFIKFFDDALPHNIGNYSPILFKVYEKVKVGLNHVN